MSKPDSSLTINVLAMAAECSKLHTQWEVFASQYSLDNETFNDLNLVIEEIFINITSHTNCNPDQPVSFTIQITENEIRMVFTDTGKEFNPLTHKAEPEQLDFSEGGMGIQLIKSLTDRQEYQRVNKQNVFTVTRHYTKVTSTTD